MAQPWKRWGFRSSEVEGNGGFYGDGGGKASLFNSQTGMQLIGLPANAASAHPWRRTRA